MSAAPRGRIPRRERLHRSDDIRSLRASGVRVRGEFVTLYVAPADVYAFAVIANRRVGIAVRRNRARRILREALRSVRSELRDDRAARMLLAATARAARARTQDVAAELVAILRGQGLIESL